MLSVCEVDIPVFSDSPNANCTGNEEICVSWSLMVGIENLDSRRGVYLTGNWWNEYFVDVYNEPPKSKPYTGMVNTYLIMSEDSPWQYTVEMWSVNYVHFITHDAVKLMNGSVIL